jgi:hypothetical protein
MNPNPTTATYLKCSMSNSAITLAKKWERKGFNLRVKLLKLNTTTQWHLLTGNPQTKVQTEKT